MTGTSSAITLYPDSHLKGFYSMTREIMGIITHTADETAAILGVTKRTLLTYIKAGKITGSKIGGSWAFTEQQIKDFINRGSVIDKSKS